MATNIAGRAERKLGHAFAVGIAAAKDPGVFAM